MQAKQDDSTPRFAQVLIAANLKMITGKDLQGASLLKVGLGVGFEYFEDVIFYRPEEYRKTKPSVNVGD